ncbi:MAG: WhiB family transcriptional regulator [Acidimicrobiales bacterium]
MSARRAEQCWQDRAACKGPHAAAFYPPASVERRGERMAREAEAKAICAGCAVRRECLDYAIAIREAHGIWGGLNECERRALLARQSG